MQKDLVFIDDNISAICDMGEYIFKSTRKEKKIKGVKRYIIEITIQDLMNELKKKCITRESIEHNFEMFLEKEKDNIKRDEEFLDKDALKEKINFYNKYSDFKIWCDEIKNLIAQDAKPESLFFLDVEFEDKIFSGYKPKTDLGKFILDYDMEWNTWNTVRDGFYDIPFLNRDELLFMLLEGKTKGKIIVDITQRLEDINSKMQESSYRQKTVFMKKVEQEYKEIQKNMNNYCGDKLIKRMLCSHLITIVESYIKNIIKLAINNKVIYKRRVVENDDRFCKNKSKIEYKDIFKKEDELTKEINKFIKDNSFQSEETIKNYIINIFKVHENEDDVEFKKFLNKYSEVLRNRHIIIHKNGVCDDGQVLDIESEKLKEYYRIIFDELKKIDRIVSISLWY